VAPLVVRRVGAAFLVPEAVRFAGVVLFTGAAGFCTAVPVFRVVAFLAGGAVFLAVEAAVLRVVVFFATAGAVAAAAVVVRLVVVRFLAGAAAAALPGVREPLGALAVAGPDLGIFLAPETRSLKPWPGRKRGTVVFLTRTRSPVCGLSGALHLLQGAEPRDLHPLPGDHRADHCVEDRVHGVLGGGAAAELLGDRLDELSLVHDDDSEPVVDNCDISSST
jgi:hypothetical protein